MLQVLEELQETIQQPDVAECVVSPDRRDALQKLEIEEKELRNLVGGIGFVSLASSLTPFSLGVFGLLLAWKPLIRLDKVTRLIKLIKLILEHFEQADVEILPLKKNPKAQPIDLLIRFPGKEFILFAIRSHGDAKVVYNEKRDAFFLKHYDVRKKGRNNLNEWKPDPLFDLGEQEFWARKNFRSFFGTKSNDSRRPMAKVLIIWKPTQLEEHQDHLHLTVSDQKFLFIRRQKGGAFYVISQDKTIDFIQAYLAHRRSQEETS